MTNIKPLLKQGFSALIFLAILALAACGPGTGGTGTGPIHFSGAASFSSSASSQAMTTVTSDATDSCSATSAQAMNLSLQQNRIELSSPCGTFSFAGAWTVSASGEAEIAGSWQASTVGHPTASNTLSATLKLKFLGAPESSPTVRVNLQGSAGQILIGSVDLLRKPS